MCHAPSSLVSSLGHVNIRSRQLLRSLEILSNAQPILPEFGIVFKLDHLVILYGIQALLHIGFLLGLYLQIHLINNGCQLILLLRALLLIWLSVPPLIFSYPVRSFSVIAAN